MKFLLKKRHVVVFSAVLFMCLSACLRDNDKGDEYPRTDAEILSFGLSSDSVTALAKTIFTIDQNWSEWQDAQEYAGCIYNRDSLPYGTIFNRKVIVTYSNAYSTNSLQRISNDTVWISDGDSLDISQAPDTFRSFPYDNDPARIKKYVLKINIHQIDPDSTQYIKVAEGSAALDFLKTEDIKAIVFDGSYCVFSKIGGVLKLYQSRDVVNWSESALYNLPDNTIVRNIQAVDNRAYAVTEKGELFITNGTVNEWIQCSTPYSVVSILGYLKVPQIASAIQKAGLCAVLDKDGQKIFGFTEDLVNWSTGDVILDNFPVHDISAFSREKNTGSLTLIGGVSATNEHLGTVWGTQDGLKWTQLKTSAKFPALIRPNVFDYDGKFRIINGYVANSSQYNSHIYVSIDGGVIWQYDAVKIARPDDYINRSDAASFVSPDGVYYYVLGGKSEEKDSEGTDKEGKYLCEIWKCFINRKNFPTDE
ncbi:MAG: DUF6242 domain-containing protein [Dysgonamonadaceae bacterium]|jgi:hypothetical protein|nr:DUF6242 domain-containing protein [Dysgonamonadaceae bacterium]